MTVPGLGIGHSCHPVIVAITQRQTRLLLGPGDVRPLYNAKTWDTPYVVAVRGLGVHDGGLDLFEGNDFPSLLSGMPSTETLIYW
jgi:hypothetical protein